MSQLQHRTTFVLILFALLIHIATNPATCRADSDQSARIISLSGKGEWQKNFTDNWQQAAVKQSLYAGNVVRTLNKSKMGLLFSDQSQIRLHHNSIMVIKQILNKDNKRTHLFLKKGRAWSKSKNIPDQLFFSTPTAVAAIRGTDWEMEVDENGTSKLTVLHGKIEFFNDYGRVIVNKDEQAFAEKGKAPVKLIISNPKQRVQWVSHYPIEPIRYLKLTSIAITDIKSNLETTPLQSIHRAQLLFDYGDIKQAEQIFKQLMTSQDKSHAQTGLIYCALARKDTVRAESLLKPLNQLSDNMLDKAKITLNILNHDFSSAEKLIMDRSKHNNADIFDFLLLADLNIYSGDYQKSLDILDKAQKQFPANHLLHAKRARIYLISDQINLAQAEVRHGLKSSPLSVENLLVSGDINHWLGNERLAKQAYHKALEINPAEDRAWFALGKMANEKEDITPAKNYLGKAIELNEQGVGYLGELGTLKTFINNLHAATVIYDSVMDKNPDDYVSLTGAGLMELKKGNIDTAIKHLLKASLLEPRYARAHTYLAIAYYQQNRTQHALQELRISSELDENDPVPYFLAAQINNENYRPANAIQDGRKALKRLPYLKSLNQIANNQKGAANLGTALSNFGMLEWGQSYAQESYYPFWAGSHLFLADSYQGDYKKNSELFQGFLTDPTVFGASNKNDPLILTPGDHAELNIFAGDSRKKDDSFKNQLFIPGIKLNGYHNSIMPFSYLLELNKQYDWSETSGNYPSDSDYSNDKLVLALGAKATEKQNLFLYINKNRIDTESILPETNTSYPNFTLSSSSKTDTNYDDSRFDAGWQYKFSPNSQLYFKTGLSNNNHVTTSSSISNSSYTSVTPVSADYEIKVISETNTTQIFKLDDEIDLYDLHLKQVFNLDQNHQIAIGLEHDQSKAKRDTNTDIISTNSSTTITTDNDLVTVSSTPASTSNTNSNSYDNFRRKFSSVYIEDKYTFNNNLLFHAGLHYSKISDEFNNNGVTEFEKNNKLQPRLGFRYKNHSGWILRAAYQNWVKPLSDYTIASVATAGIPLDENYLAYGGEKDQVNIQFESEFKSDTFIKIFSQAQKIKNSTAATNLLVNSIPTYGLLDLRSLRDSMLDYARKDPLQALSNQARQCDTECELITTGISVNHLLSDTLSARLFYANNYSRITTGDYQDQTANYTPRHNVKLALKWINHSGVEVAARVNYLSKMRAGDLGFDSGTSWLLDVSKETNNKHLKLFALASYNDISETNAYYIGANYRF